MEEDLKPGELPENINFEVKSTGEVTDRDLQDLREFSEAQLNVALEATQTRSEGWVEKWEAAYVHGKAASSLEMARLNDSPVNLVLARNSDGKLIGYSLIVLDPQARQQNQKVRETFIGVSPESQRQKIGVNLLKKRIESLINLGITTYTTHARPQAVQLYVSLGIQFTAEPQPHHPEAKILTVSLV